MAWVTARTNVPGARTLEVLNTIPFFLSPFVGAVAWVALAAPNTGMLNRLAMQWLGLAEPPLNPYTVPGMVWVMSLFYIPYVYIFVVGSFRSMDPSMEEAAKMSGDRNHQVARYITFPLVAPGPSSPAGCSSWSPPRAARTCRWPWASR